MNLISVIEYAYMSSGVYHRRQENVSNPTFLKNFGWIIPIDINDTTNFKSNFFGRLYLKRQHGKVIAAVVAFRGTMPLQHPYNDISDFQMAVLHELPISYQSARVFFHKARWYVRENYPDVLIKLTGHSLGGALAQLIAAKNEQVSVVFNSPGIGDLPDIHTDKSYSRIHNINAKDDYINKVGKTIGTIQTIEVMQGESDLKEASKIEHENINPVLGMSGIMAQEADAEAERLSGYYKQHLIANMIDALQHQTLSPPNNFY